MTPHEHEDDRTMVCVPWGEQVVESEMRICADCGMRIASDRRNKPFFDSGEVQEAICMFCLFKRTDSGSE